MERRQRLSGNDLRWYVDHGYHFLALSDHNILSQGEKWISADAGAKRGAIDGFKRYQAAFGSDWVETREAGGATEVRLKTLAEFRPLFEKPGQFLLLQAEEITDHFGSLPIHINASNLVELIRPRGGDSVRDTIARNLDAVEQQSRRLGRPILAHLNHPNYGYAVTPQDLAAVRQERFFEVYNGHPAVAHLGDDEHVGVERMWDIANTIRIAEAGLPPLFGLATDDSHNYFGQRDSSPGRGWVMVRAPRLAAAELVQSIERGEFYASSGVVLEQVHFDRSQRQLRIRIQPRPGVQFTTRFIGTPRNYDRQPRPGDSATGRAASATQVYSAEVGKSLQVVDGTEPTYTLTGDELYVRAVVTSTQEHPNPSFEGQREQAWTQPVGWRTE